MSFLDKFNDKQRFDFETPDEFEYRTLSDLVTKYGIEAQHQVKALFINTKGKFGDSAVGVTDKELVNLPHYLTDTVKKMIDDEELVQMVNDGKVGFTIREYTSKQYGKNFTIDWVQI